MGEGYRCLAPEVWAVYGRALHSIILKHVLPGFQKFSKIVSPIVVRFPSVEINCMFVDVRFTNCDCFPSGSPIVPIMSKCLLYFYFTSGSPIVVRWLVYFFQASGLPIVVFTDVGVTNCSCCGFMACSEIKSPK